MKYFFFLLFSLTVFSQTKPLEIKIDAITFTDTITHRLFTQNGNPFKTDTIKARKFTIQYHITNLTEDPIRFIFENDDISDRLYQNQDFLFDHFMRTECAYYNGFFSFGPPPENMQAISETQFQNEKEDIRNSILTINPKQEQKFTTVFYWEKDGFLSLYMGEKQPNFIEISIQLKKGNLAPFFTPEELEAQSKDKNFIYGTFVSDKFPINFKE